MDWNLSRLSRDLLKSKNGKSCTKPSKMDEFCKTENIDHRLTKPYTPKTNGMVERANGIIKSNTILKEKYADKEEMNTHMLKFLVFYILYRRHGSLKKELGVRTPFEAMEKWHEFYPVGYGNFNNCSINMQLSYGVNRKFLKKKIFCSLTESITIASSN